MARVRREAKEKAASSQTYVESVPLGCEARRSLGNHIWASITFLPTDLDFLHAFESFLSGSVGYLHTVHFMLISIRILPKRKRSRIQRGFESGSNRNPYLDLGSSETKTLDGVLNRL
jgi:hypothetical protein